MTCRLSFPSPVYNKGGGGKEEHMGRKPPEGATERDAYESELRMWEARQLDAMAQNQAAWYRNSEAETRERIDIAKWAIGFQATVATAFGKRIFAGGFGRAAAVACVVALLLFCASAVMAQREYQWNQDNARLEMDREEGKDVEEEWKRGQRRARHGNAVNYGVHCAACAAATLAWVCVILRFICP